MRFTIERLRTLVLVAGVLLVIALGLFLSVGRFKNRFNRRDIPHKLGKGIQEEANGFVYTHEVRGHILYKIRASKQLQVKKDKKVMLQLHDVMIELYAEDGSRVDRIAGDEFDYNPDSGIASAVGPVEITLMKPTVAPAIAPKATANQAIGSKQTSGSLVAAAQTAASGEIHVRTSGLVFDRNSGEASTTEKVEFTLTQGDGSAIGAKYDSHAGLLVLDHQVELSIQRGAELTKMFAQHAVFNRDEQACQLHAATVRSGEDVSSAEEAKVYFRDDGSAERLEVDRGFSLETSTGGRLAAPTGTLLFDEHNRPKHGHLQGGVTLDSENHERKVHGTSPAMEMEFSNTGELSQVHLERGVQIASDEETESTGGLLRTHREWASPVADLALRGAAKGRVEPASIHGMGGVLVKATTQRGNGPVTPEKLSADDVTGEFGPNGALTKMTGHGRTTIEQMTANGTLQTMSGDVLVAHLAAPENAKGNGRSASAGTQIQSATVEGHVVLVQQPPAKPGEAQQTLRATAGHADYDENAGKLLHLTVNPRVTDGGVELIADKLDVSQESGDAFALGNVKATSSSDPAKAGKKATGTEPGADFGAQGPAHVVAQQAESQRATSTATFKGNARLWQQGNSVAAPVIVLDRTKQTLTAQSTSSRNPVQVVLVSATTTIPGSQSSSKQNGPSVVRVRGGDLKYSSADRKAVMRAGAAGSVIATTADASTSSNEVEIIMLPPGNHAGKDGATGQVDRMISTGHVVVSSNGRRGTGEQLVYTGATGNYVLTGTAAAPPQLFDPNRGRVTGQALIFNSRDDSVSIEGDGSKTTTITTAPK
jgi:lipopolysaccharide export system protein LptA